MLCPAENKKMEIGNNELKNKYCVVLRCHVDVSCSYNWTCYVLLSRDMSCFIDNSSVWLDNNRTLTIPGSQFKPDIDNFVFTLTVSKVGRASSNITQVLQMERQEVLE